MGPKTRDLVEVLSYLCRALEEDGNTHWADWMNSAKASLEKSDFSGVEKVLAAYGGMGSFNDVYLTKITRENESFSVSRSKAWELANQIKHDHEITT